MTSPTNSSLIITNLNAERVVIVDADGELVLSEIFADVPAAVDAAKGACYHSKLTPKPWRVESAPMSICGGLVR